MLLCRATLLEFNSILRLFLKHQDSRSLLMVSTLISWTAACCPMPDY
jgi:hypothetical protein